MIEAGRGLAQCLTLLLNIPIGVVKILVPQIAGQQHQALRDRIAHATPVSPAFYRERRRGPLRAAVQALAMAS